MKLGLHYHIPLWKKDDGLYTLGFFGVFVDSLAAQVDELVCFMHSPIERDLAQSDYKLQAANIRFIDIGPHDALYYRLLRSPRTIRNLRSEFSALDHLLIRTPTPLIFQFAAHIPKEKITLLLVGDYAEGSKTLNLPAYKAIPIKIWSARFNRQLERLIPKVNVLTNSNHLQQRFSPLNPNIRVVRTTTLSAGSFFTKEDTCTGPQINLLYTGRIDTGKGILEMAEAMTVLRKKGYNLHLSIAGWDDDPAARATQQLRELAAKLGVEQQVHLLGRKQIGEELNAVYRDADIYLMCSQVTEGFPRTIWEAMANSLPVIATKVGSMPHFLSNEETALLIDPMQVSQLTAAIEKIITDKALRQKLIENGRELAKDNTLENQARMMVNAISHPVTASI